MREPGDRPVWIHVDWDVLEPGSVPAAYAIEAGLSPEALRAIFAEIPRQQIIGVELAEFEASDDETEDGEARWRWLQKSNNCSSSDAQGEVIGQDLQ